MEVAQQVGAQPHIGACQGGFFALQVLLELAQRGLVQRLGLELVQQAQLNHPAGLKGLACFVFRGFHHIPAAPRTHGDDAARGQPGQRLAHDGAAAVKQHGQLLLAQA